MKKIKIVFDANPLVIPKSGVGYFTQGLIQSLADALRDEVQLVGYYFNFFGRKSPDNLPSAPNIHYVPVKFLPGKFLNGLRRLGLQIPLELLTRQTADVALFPNFVSLPALSGSLNIVAVHDLCFIDCPHYVSDRNASFMRKWVPKSLHKADIVLTISNFTKRRIIQDFGIAAGKIHIMPIPPQPQAVPDFTILKKHGLTGGYLLFVGTIEPRKNVAGLIEAYALLPPAVRDQYPLVLVGGKGWHDEEITAAIARWRAERMDIIQTGYVSDAAKSALYTNATLCVQPSHYEGFGMPILEAMSYGKPVACSDIEVFHEVGGDAPQFFDQDKPELIAQSVSSLLKNPDRLENLARRSQDRIAGFPAWESVVKEFYERVVREVEAKN